VIPVTPAPYIIAQEAPAAAPNAAIEKILADAAAAYRSATSLSMTLESSQPQRKVTVALTLLKTGKLAAAITNGKLKMRVVGDGTNVYIENAADMTKYVKQPGTTLQQSVQALSQNGGAGVGLLPILLNSPKAEKQIIPGKPSAITKDADETIDSVACDVITAVLGNEDKKTAYRFAIGKSDHFLRRLTIGPLDGTPTITETYSKITTKPKLAPTTFVYTPAKGAVATAPPKEPDYYDQRLKVGAEPFKLVGVDLEGKAVSYEDYKGKVLLVDFWATWCGPCIAELPNVQEAYNKYHDQGFEVLGISLDQETARAKLETFIKDKNMPWRQIYDGKYWKSANAVNYGIRAIPFTLLIGKDGKIAAVGARGADLAPAIEAALKK
jgi:thiol-disulfide isomerase/thioredoxin/outer membrane lipoprotein-sorting protein